MLCFKKKLSRYLPTATFVSPGRSMRVKFTTAGQNHALSSHKDKLRAQQIFKGVKDYKNKEKKVALDNKLK